jgi:hypothetical protein
MRRHGTALRGGHLLLAALLALPPCLRVGIHLWSGAKGPAVHPELMDAARKEAAERGLDPASIRPIDLDFEDPAGRYRAVPADAIPFSDTSPSRHVIWAVTRGGAKDPPQLEGNVATPGGAAPDVFPGEVVTDTAAVSRGALVGRVIGVYPELGLARIQTMRDPGFRVRFSTDTGTGMLRPAGSDRDGDLLLEPLYLSPGCELVIGTPVLTAGNDGVYPPGVVIGRVEGADGPAGGDGDEDPGRLMVRAALRPDEVIHMALAVDVSKANARSKERRIARENSGK